MLQRVLQPKQTATVDGASQALVIGVHMVYTMQADTVDALLAKGHEVGWGPLGGPRGCFSES